MNIFRAINNLVFPPRCIFCDRVLDFRTKLNVCTKCTDAVRIPCGTRCSVCFSETRGYFGTDLCENCRKEKPYYDKVRSAFVYEGAVRDCVIRLKFHKRTDHAPTMGHYMSQLIDKECSADMLIPIPISKSRLRERGYNQSELFTKHISSLTGIPMRTDLLFKIKDTEPQSSLKYEKRAENVKGAYKTADSSDLKDKHIILTDDVATTRSTLNECARMLKKAGAKTVECITFAVVKGDT